MKGPEQGTGTVTAKVLGTVVLLLAWVGGTTWCVAKPSQKPVPRSAPLTQSEQSLRRALVHVSEYVPVSEALASKSCGQVRPPEALLTPDPILPGDDELPVRVSFIVGSDGHVHSAFVLEGGHLDEDQLILRAVLRWRYRPALCNGVPTDSEARVRFGLR